MTCPNSPDGYRVIDLYCGAGGCSVGYERGGWKIELGVDDAPQPNYPYTFLQIDAIEFLASIIKSKNYGWFDVIHASPPCQKYTKAAKQWRKEGRKYPDLVEETRNLLVEIGKPFIIEGVPDTPLIDPLYLNGGLFDLLVHRPRYFEIWPNKIKQPLIPPLPKPAKMGRSVKEGDVIQPVGHFSGVQYARKQMEIDWMTGQELSQAIPPAYTKWIVENWPRPIPHTERMGE